MWYACFIFYFQLYQSMELVQKEKDYIAKNLELEQQERSQLELINRDLKMKVQNLHDGPEGINQKFIQINELQGQINLQNERINDLNSTIQEQNQVICEQRQDLLITKQSNQEKDDWIYSLQQKQNELNVLLEGKTNDYEFNCTNLIKQQEELRAKQFQDQEQSKALQHQLQELSLKLNFEKETKEKLQNVLDHEKTNFNNLSQHYHELEDAVSQSTQENQLLQNQLENSLIQISKLSEALEYAQMRIESLASQNQKLLADLSVLRTSLYSDALVNQDNLPSALMEQFSQLNLELQEKLRAKEEELLNLKQANNALKMKNLQFPKEQDTTLKAQNEQQNLSHSKGRSGIIRCLKESTSYQIAQDYQMSETYKSSKKRVQIEKENEAETDLKKENPRAQMELKNPGKSIQDLLESAHKHAKLMKRILKDLEQQDEKNKVPKLSQRNIVEETPTPKRQLQYDLDSGNWQ